MTTLLAGHQLDVWEFYYDTCQSIDVEPDHPEYGTSAMAFDSAVQRVLQATGAAGLVVVSHSMGGIV